MFRYRGFPRDCAAIFCQYTVDRYCFHRVCDTMSLWLFEVVCSSGGESFSISRGIERLSLARSVYISTDRLYSENVLRVCRVVRDSNHAACPLWMRPIQIKYNASLSNVKLVNDNDVFGLSLRFKGRGANPWQNYILDSPSLLFSLSSLSCNPIIRGQLS